MSFFYFRCLCSFCQILPLAKECVCCQEIPEICHRMEEGITLLKMKNGMECITNHPGFNAVCLDPFSLQVAWLSYKQQYGGNQFEGPIHAKYRHIAYRQLVRWCWEYLGKDFRVVLPSCAVSCIRAHFPPPGDEENFTFIGFRSSVLYDCLPQL